MDTLRNDIVYAIRTLRKSPGFALTAILTLALGIGASTAIFSVVNAVLIRSLPFERPESLVVLWGNVERGRVERRGASYPDFLDWRAQSTSFEGMAAYWDLTVTVPGPDGAERIDAEAVSPGYFRLLGIAPLRGRVFDTDEDAVGSRRVAVISHAFWMRRYGGANDVLGQPLRFDGEAWTIVGVLPPGVRGLTDRAELWVNAGGVLDANDSTSRGTRWFPALARLKSGVDAARAQADLGAVARRLEQAYPETNEKRGVEVASLTTELVGDIEPVLIVALSAVGIVLLIACANVAGLVVARAETRGREIAIRMALGAGRRRLARQMLTEGLLLAVAAGALGLLLTGWITDALLAASPIAFPGYVRVSLDPAVIAFAAGVTLLLGIALGFAPAGGDGGCLVERLKESSGRASAGLRSLKTRQGIVVAEVGLALVLLVASGLLLRSLAALTRVDPGFQPEGLLTCRVSLPSSGGDAEEPAAAGGTTGQPRPTVTGRNLLERLRALPGVQRVALSSTLPLGGGSAIFYTAEGQPPTDARTMPRAYVHRVTPDFFTTLGVERIRGRAFSDSDSDRQNPVVIVSETVAKRFWPGEDPIGRRIKPGRPGSDAPWLEVVGVVGEMRYRALPRNPTPDPDLFLPYNPADRNVAVLVRTSGEPAALAKAVRGAVREVAPSAAVYDVATMEERVSEQLAGPRFAGWITGAFATVALLLAAIGLYGVVSQSVIRRTREIGVRVALGASPSAILVLVLRQGLGLCLTGLLLGVACALVVARALGALLFNVGPTDPVTLASVSVLLLGVSLAAACIPARRAVRVDPLVAIRME